MPCANGLYHLFVMWELGKKSWRMTITCRCYVYIFHIYTVCRCRYWVRSSFSNLICKFKPRGWLFSILSRVNTIVQIRASKADSCTNFILCGHVFIFHQSTSFPLLLVAHYSQGEGQSLMFLFMEWGKRLYSLKTLWIPTWKKTNSYGSSFFFLFLFSVARTR